MSLLIKNWSKANWEELLKWAKIGANNAMIGELAEVEELHPHGRLIDADAMLNDACSDCEPLSCDNNCTLVELIKNSPIVIEEDYPPSIPLKQVWAEVFGEDGE